MAEEIDAETRDAEVLTTDIELQPVALSAPPVIDEVSQSAIVTTSFVEPTGINKILVEKYGYEWVDGVRITSTAPEPAAAPAPVPEDDVIGITPPVTMIWTVLLAATPHHCLAVTWAVCLELTPHQCLPVAWAVLMVVTLHQRPAVLRWWRLELTRTSARR